MARLSKCDEFNASEIRVALRESERAHDPTAAMFDEMPLRRGDGRADLAVVNGALSGFEIKSGKDSLARLAHQIPLYEAIFDYCHVVVTERHLDAARSSAPSAWGIRLVERLDASVPRFHTIREAWPNRGTDSR